MIEKLFHLDIERAGIFGPKTVILNAERFRTDIDRFRDIQTLHSVIEGWKGDGIIVAGERLVTEDLANDLIQEGMTGFRLDDVIVSKSQAFKNRQRNRPEFVDLPPFRWLQVDGTASIKMDSTIVDWSGHDITSGTRVDFVHHIYPPPGFVPHPNSGLVVSQRCLDILQKHRLNHCGIEEINWPE